MLSPPGRRPPDRRGSRRGWRCSRCRGGRRWWRCQRQHLATGGTACLAHQWVLACVGGAGWKLSSRNNSTGKDETVMQCAHLPTLYIGRQQAPWKAGAHRRQPASPGTATSWHQDFIANVCNNTHQPPPIPIPIQYHTTPKGNFRTKLATILSSNAPIGKTLQSAWL